MGYMHPYLKLEERNKTIYPKSCSFIYHAHSAYPLIN